MHLLRWYLVGKGDGYRVVAYRGDTQQGPYDGAFVFTREKDALLDASLREEVDASIANAGLKPEQMVRRRHPLTTLAGPLVAVGNGVLVVLVGLLNRSSCALATHKKGFRGLAGRYFTRM